MTHWLGVARGNGPKMDCQSAGQGMMPCMFLPGALAPGRKCDRLRKPCVRSRRLAKQGGASACARYNEIVRVYGETQGQGQGHDTFRASPAGLQLDVGEATPEIVGTRSGCSCSWPRRVLTTRPCARLPFDWQSAWFAGMEDGRSLQRDSAVSLVCVMTPSPNRVAKPGDEGCRLRRPLPFLRPPLGIQAHGLYPVSGEHQGQEQKRCGVPQRKALQYIGSRTGKHLEPILTADRRSATNVFMAPEGSAVPAL